MCVAREWPLRGIALCLQGVDGDTSAQFAAGDTVELTVVPRKPIQPCENSNKQTTSQFPLRDNQQMSVATAAKAAETVVEATEKVVETAEAVVVKAVEAPVKAAEAVVEKVEAVAHAVAIDDGAEGVVDLPVETPAAEVKKTVEAAKVLSRPDGTEFLKAFGDRGGVWYAKGYSFEQATAEHIKQLSAENAELKERLLASRGAEPVSFSTSEEERPKGKHFVSAKAKQLTEQGISPFTAALMASTILIPKEK